MLEGMAIEAPAEILTTYAGIGQTITCTPGLQGGQPCVAGTRMRVRTLVDLTERGLAPEEIAADYGGLHAPQIYAALAFFHANREQLLREWADSDGESERLEAEIRATQAPSLRERKQV